MEENLDFRGILDLGVQTEFDFFFKCGSEALLLPCPVTKKLALLRIVRVGVLRARDEDTGARGPPAVSRRYRRYGSRCCAAQVVLPKYIAIRSIIMDQTSCSYSSLGRIIRFAVIFLFSFVP